MEFSDQELSDLKKEHAPQASEEQFRLWLTECRNRNAVPGKDIFLQIRNANEWDDVQRKKVFKKKAIYITSVAFLRKIAQRTGNYGGQLPSVWVYLDADGMPSIQSEVPLPSKQPWAAKVSVIRKDWNQPLVVTARWDAYAQTFEKDGTVQLNPTWKLRGPEQLEKCAEALALRKAFPEEIGTLYSAEEADGFGEVVVEKQTRKRSVSTSTQLIYPTAADKEEYSKRLRKYAEITGSEELKTFVTEAMGKKISTATKLEWESVLSALDGCKGPEEIKQLVNKENK